MTTKTPKFIYIIAVIVIVFLIGAVAHANYQVLLRVDPIKFIGFKVIDPMALPTKAVNSLYNSYTVVQHVIAGLLALGYSLSTMLVIVYYGSTSNKWHRIIKVLFIGCDAAIMYLYLGKGYDIWWSYGSYIYATYTALILFFVGQMAANFINEYQKEVANTPVVVTGNTNNQKQINARKQWLRRRNLPFENDEVLLELLKTK